LSKSVNVVFEKCQAGGIAAISQGTQERKLLTSKVLEASLYVSKVIFRVADRMPQEHRVNYY